MPPAITVPALFCMVDVLRRPAAELGHPITQPSDVEALDDARAQVTAWVQNLNGRVTVIATEPGISLDTIAAEAVAATVQETVAQIGNEWIDMSLICPHTDNCWCKPPRPGLVLQAISQFYDRANEIITPELTVIVGTPGDQSKEMADALGVVYVDGDTWRRDGFVPDGWQVASPAVEMFSGSIIPHHSLPNPDLSVPPAITETEEG